MLYKIHLKYINLQYITKTKKGSFLNTVFLDILLKYEVILT